MFVKGTGDIRGVKIFQGVTEGTVCCLQGVLDVFEKLQRLLGFRSLLKDL